MEEARRELLRQAQESSTSFTPLPKSEYRSVQLSTPGQDYEFLGGVTNQQRGKQSWISKFPKYASLPRPRVLKPWKGKISDPDIDSLFRLTHDEGKLFFKAAVLPTEEQCSLHLCMACNDPVRCPPKYLGFLMDILFKQNEGVVSGNRVYGANVLHVGILNHSLKTFLPEEETQALAIRAVHLFLRHRGRDFFEASAIIQQCFQISGMLEQRRRWFDNLDILMVAADVALSSPKVDEKQKFSCVVQVGKALKAVGRFADGAKIYFEVASAMDEQCEESRLAALNQAGLGFRAANMLAEAEKAYLVALCTDSQAAGSPGSWDLNRDVAAAIISNLLALYNSWRLQEGIEAAETIQEVDNVLTILAGILYKAGFKKGCEQAGTMIAELGPLINKKLKSAAKSKAGSRKLLVKACNTKEPQAFRAVLKSCAPAGCVFLAHRDNNGFDSRACRKNDKEVARARESEFGNELDFGASTCSNPTCSKSQTFVMASEIRNCPCRLAGYCSKACQVEHWTVHKNICTARKKKKA